VRIPNLNWPNNLFTDLSPPLVDTIESLSAINAQRPALWNELLDTWMGQHAIREQEWNRSLSRTEQVAL